jgi:hypothetical protein
MKIRGRVTVVFATTGAEDGEEHNTNRDWAGGWSLWDSELVCIAMFNKQFQYEIFLLTVFLRNFSFEFWVVIIFGAFWQKIAKSGVTPEEYPQGIRMYCNLLDTQQEHKQWWKDKFVSRDMNPQKKENNVWFLNSGAGACIQGKFIMPPINELRSMNSNNSAYKYVNKIYCTKQNNFSYKHRTPRQNARR